MSGDWLSHIAPRVAMFEHGVEHNQQFAHGRPAHFFRLTRCQQPLVEVPDSRVVPASFANSVMVRYLDYNDIGVGGHSSGSIPGALTMADYL